MANKVTTIDGLAQLMTAGFDTMGERFDRLEDRMDRAEKIQDEHTQLLQEHSQILREHSKKLITLDSKVDKLIGVTMALEADIKELYRMIAELRKDLAKETRHLPEYRARLENLELFARNVSHQTGIKFTD